MKTILRRLINIYQKLMNKRIGIKIFSAILILLIGWLIGSRWKICQFVLDLQINIVDAVSLLVTVAMGLYIARILEKEVQDNRIEKDMYLSKISVIENLLETIETMFQNKNGIDLDYKFIVNLEHRIRTKKNSIFEHIVVKSKRKIKDEIQAYEKLLKDDFKDLRNYLTQTNASEEGTKDISIENNIAKYSSERTSLILTSLNSIENKLLELKVLINKM